MLKNVIKQRVRLFNIHFEPLYFVKKKKNIKNRYMSKYLRLKNN